MRRKPAPMLLLGIGAPEIYFYLSNYRPLSWDYLYSFGPDPLPVTLIGEDRRIQVYRLRSEEPLQVLVMRQDVPGSSAARQAPGSRAGSGSWNMSGAKVRLKLTVAAAKDGQASRSAMRCRAAAGRAFNSRCISRATATGR